MALVKADMLNDYFRAHPKFSGCIVVFCLFGLCALFLGCGGGSYGTQQGRSISVEGLVLATTGLPLEGVAISDTASNATTTTDAAGAFTIAAFLPEGEGAVELIFEQTNLSIPAAPDFTTIVEVRRDSEGVYELISALPKTSSESDNQSNKNPEEPIDEKDSGGDDSSVINCGDSCDKDADRDNREVNKLTPAPPSSEDNRQGEEESSPSPTQTPTNINPGNNNGTKTHNNKSR